MHRPRSWRRPRLRGVSEIVGTILLLGLTIAAGVILWSFRIDPAQSPPQVSFSIRSGGANPVWGDPTDCQPWGTWHYPLRSSQWGTWETEWLNQCYPYNIYTNAPQLPTGNFSLLNTSQLIVSGVSATNIPLADINFEFVCHNSTATGGTTILVQGSLAAMSWFPGQSIAPSVSNPPTLGYCGNFDASNFGGGAFGTLYNRLGIFVPISGNSSTLQAGDTFILYIHNGGWPIDYECADPYLYGCGPSIPSSDADDYHGAPPWCFTSETACSIELSYTGNPATLLASIPVYSLAPPVTA